MFSFLKGAKKSGWLSVLLMEREVMAVRVVPTQPPSPCRYAIENALQIPLTGSVVQALLQLKGRLPIKTYRTVTLMQEGGYHITPMDVPSVPENEQKEALRWALKDVMTYPPEDAVIQLLPLPSDHLPAGRSSGLMVVSADGAAVKAWAMPFEEAGIRLDAIDVPEMALCQIASLLADENRGLVLLYMGSDGFILVLNFQGKLVAVRKGDVSSAQVGSDDEFIRERSIDRLTLELQRTLDHFDRQFSHIHISKMVVASLAGSESLANQLKDALFLAISPFDLSNVIDFSRHTELQEPSQQVHWLMAIGAALRNGGVAG